MSGAELAALGVASSVIAVVDFGTKFLALCRTNAPTPEALTAVHSLQANATALGNVLADLTTHSSGGINDGIAPLASECSVVLKQMLDTLDSIGASKRGNVLKALKSAVLLKWNEKDLETLQDRLNDFTHQISLNLTVSVRQVCESQVTAHGRGN